MTTSSLLIVLTIILIQIYNETVQIHIKKEKNYFFSSANSNFIKGEGKNERLVK